MGCLEVELGTLAPRQRCELCQGVLRGIPYAGVVIGATLIAVVALCGEWHVESEQFREGELCGDVVLEMLLAG